MSQLPATATAVQSLEALYRLQMALLQRLQQAGEVERRALADGDLPAFTNSLDQRQVLLARLDTTIRQATDAQQHLGPLDAGSESALAIDMVREAVLAEAVALSVDNAAMAMLVDRLAIGVAQERRLISLPDATTGYTPHGRILEPGLQGPGVRA